MHKQDKKRGPKPKLIFENSCPTYVRALLLFGAKDDEWITRGSLDNYGIKQGTWDSSRADEEIKSNYNSLTDEIRKAEKKGNDEKVRQLKKARDDVRKGKKGLKYKLQHEGIIVEDREARQYDAKSYRTQKETYWNEIFKCLAELFDEAFSNRKNIFSALSSNEDMYTDSAIGRQLNRFISKKDDEAQQWLISQLKVYFSNLLNNKNYAFNRSIKTLLKEFLLISETKNMYDNDTDSLRDDFRFLCFVYTLCNSYTPERAIASNPEKIYRDVTTYWTSEQQKQEASKKTQPKKS